MKIEKERDFSKITDFLHNNFSSPTHWPDWNLVISSYFNTEFYYLVAIENAEIIGVCPIHLLQNGFLKNSYSGQFHFIPFGGWIFKRKVKLSKNFFPLDFFSSYKTFSLPSIAEFGSDYGNFSYIQKKTLIVDLNKEIQSIWKEDIHSKRRNMIRKAENKQIDIQINQDFNNFYRIYEEATIRSQLSILPKEFFKELFVKAQNIGFDILTAELEGQTLANIVISYDKFYSIYWLGNNANGVPNLGQGELLQFEAIKLMKSKGCRYYDLCYIEKDELPHIYKFKNGFTKSEVDVPLILNKSFLYKVYNKAMKWF
ncbi:MAG: GNAT family N-acetyltransferase [Melioribacteraceae bacterium]|nr:GNAT family N-acetyltransferase [Melioribacteraceae bacterium]MCF8265931.1 GNAT family N-acetyltransferase [Melioribacteraceae bacterium]